VSAVRFCPWPPSFDPLDGPFDVVHAHGLEHFRPLAGRVRISHFHNDPLWDDRRETLQAQASEFRRVARDTRAQVAVSEYVADRLRCGFEAAAHDRPLATNVRVVPNGVDLAGYQPELLDAERVRWRSEWGVKPKDVVFLFSGAVVSEKGVESLARAFIEVAKRRSGVHLVVAGGGRLWGGALDVARGSRNGYERRVTEMLTEGVRQGFVHLPGILSGSAMPGIYAASDVVVAPSLAQEAFGLSILEGMAAGRPAIATAVGGVPELVDGSNGILIEPGNTGELVAALDLMAEDPAMRQLLSRGAKKSAVRYTWEAAAGQVEALYVALLGAPPNAP
jgi:glycosyltransferase involved in cell wall biosynthesis